MKNILLGISIAAVTLAACSNNASDEKKDMDVKKDASANEMQSNTM